MDQAQLGHSLGVCFAVAVNGGWAGRPRRLLHSYIWCLSWDEGDSWGVTGQMSPFLHVAASRG